MPAATVPDVVRLARRQRPPLPDDVGANQAGARTAANPVETLEVTLPPGEALENVPRSAREAGHDGRRRGHARSGSCARERRSSRRGARSASSPRRRARAAVPRGDAASRPEPRRAAARRRPRSSATRASSCCPSGRRWRSSRCATRACSVIGAGALGSPVALYLAGRGRRAARDRRRRRRRALQPAPPAAALHARRRACRRSSRAAAKLRFLNPEIVVEPYQVRVDADERRRAGRGPGPRGRLLGLLRDPLRRQRGLLRGRRRPRRGRRGGLERARDDDRAGAHRLLPLRVPDGAGRTRRRAPGGHPRARRGRDRLAAGARGAEVPDRRAARRWSTRS